MRCAVVVTQGFRVELNFFTLIERRVQLKFKLEFSSSLKIKVAHDAK